MRILLTNDDGILADGIQALYRTLSKIADVIVVAPDSERSSVGHSITLARPIYHTPNIKTRNFTGHGISGTPADCVKFALAILKIKPDLVFSGINLGPNDGCSTFYSGTVAAAREGALSGIPSVAVSVATFSHPDFSAAAQCGAKLAKLVYKKGLPADTFLNVNVPNIPMRQIKATVVTSQGRTPIHGIFKTYRTPAEGTFYWLTGFSPKTNTTDTSDTHLLKKNCITITPTTIDVTQYQALSILRKWPL